MRQSYTLANMTLAKPPDKTERVNVVIPKSVQEIAAKLMRARLKGDNFSELLRDLINEEAKRPETADKAEMAWLNRAFRESMAETVALKEEILKLKSKVERLKRDRDGLASALDLAEADLKKARAPRI